MKKIVLLLSILMCVGTMVACEHSHEKGKEYQSDENYHWFVCTDSECDVTIEKAKHSWDGGDITTKPTATQDGVRTFICKDCKKMKQESVKYVPASTVKDFQWENAFARSRFLNVTAKITEEIFMFELAYKNVYDIQVNNNMIYSVITAYKNGTEVKYSAKFQDGNTVWRLNNKEQYIEDVTPQINFDTMEPTAVLTDYGFDYLSDCFDSFTYNEKTKSYEATNLSMPKMSFDFKQISVRMEDGQVAEIVAVTTNNPELCLTVTYSEYGKTTPTPPTKAENK